MYTEFVYLLWCSRGAVIISLNTMNRVTKTQFVNSEVGYVFLRVTEVNDSQAFASCLRVVNLSREKESLF
jgi:hypothetical protein